MTNNEPFRFPSNRLLFKFLPLKCEHLTAILAVMNDLLSNLHQIQRRSIPRKPTHSSNNFQLVGNRLLV